MPDLAGRASHESLDAQSLFEDTSPGLTSSASWAGVRGREGSGGREPPIGGPGALQLPTAPGQPAILPAGLPSLCGHPSWDPVLSCGSTSGQLGSRSAHLT